MVEDYNPFVDVMMQFTIQIVEMGKKEDVSLIEESRLHKLPLFQSYKFSMQYGVFFNLYIAFQVPSLEFFSVMSES